MWGIVKGEAHYIPCISPKCPLKNDEAIRKVAGRINTTLLELWGCRQEHINISYEAVPPEEWDERIERGEIARNRDKMLMLGGEWTSREKSPANVHAMHMLQEQMKGQAAAAGLTSEDDVAEWITQSRREENAELPAGRT